MMIRPPCLAAHPGAHTPQQHHRRRPRTTSPRLFSPSSSKETPHPFVAKGFRETPPSLEPPLGPNPRSKLASPGTSPARIPDELALDAKSMLRLDCAVQQYQWGKLGMESTVAQLKKGGGGPGYEVHAEQRYAELWMGTHPSGPSRVLPTHPGESPVMLKEYLQSNPAAMGSTLAAASPSGDLPFMFKVLSISKALSIQAHPDKALAARLHAARPSEYRDANHKPEMAISLTDFEAMCGFRPLPDVVAHMKAYPELRALVSDQAFALLDPVPAAEEEQKRALKAVFSSYMTADDTRAAQQVAALAARLSAQPEAGRSPVDALMLRLHRHFPGDRGLMGPLFLNFLRLGPGQAFVMAANEPHAYLSGDILECMACSDNVVRLGLTPKYRDVPTLLEMLTYNSGRMVTTEGELVKTPQGLHRRFTPPSSIPEFEVETLLLQPHEAASFRAVDGPSLLLVLAGEGSAEGSAGDDDREALHRGYVFMVPANTDLRLRGAGAAPLHVAIAHHNTSTRAARRA